MAKRKSNRAVRLTLCVPIAGYGYCFKISNRRWQVYDNNHPHVWQHVKPSRSQRRAKRLAEEMRIERHFEFYYRSGLGLSQAMDEAIRIVKGETQEKAL
uniref:hypothetical protein n=1 Tax=Serratia quinivorans TaxID=137545 RepID=UPI0035C72257